VQAIDPALIPEEKLEGRWLELQNCDEIERSLPLGNQQIPQNPRTFMWYRLSATMVTGTL